MNLKLKLLFRTVFYILYLIGLGFLNAKTCSWSFIDKTMINLLYAFLMTLLLINIYILTKKSKNHD